MKNGIYLICYSIFRDLLTPEVASYYKHIINCTYKCTYYHCFYYIGTNDGHHTFLLISSIVLIIFSVISLIINGLTLWSTGLTQIYLLFKTFKRYRVFFEIILAVCIFVFVTGYYSTRSWCAKNYQWHFGAICTFLSWITVLISLKFISSHTNKLFTIINQFMKLSFLPVVLLIAFFLPFVMLFTSPWPVSIFT